VKLTRRIFKLVCALPIVATCLIAERSSAEFTDHAHRHAVNGPLITRNQMHDVSPPLRSLIESDTETVAIALQTPTPVPTPPDMSSPAGAAAVEQRRAGTSAAAIVVESFDGLGAGFKGLQGTAILRNPSDNSLAVGPDHIFQIVNTRIAIYSKKGQAVQNQWRHLVWARADEYDFQRFRRRLREP
jgi:hypothetical protein